MTIISQPSRNVWDDPIQGIEPDTISSKVGLCSGSNLRQFSTILAINAVILGTVASCGSLIGTLRQTRILG